MKILLISPVVAEEKRTPNALTIPQLALHILAGLTPEEHDVKIVEEEYELADLNETCDLVGISCMTSTVTRGYELAREYKSRGKTVVMGGIHPTVLPDEAILNCDSVVVGEAENVWVNLLNDFANGKLQKFYKGGSPTLDQYVHLPTRSQSKKSAFNAIPTETTRGCPFTCDFCSVPEFYGRKLRHRPVEHVVRDLIESKGKNYVFLDDNILGKASYAKKLFEEIRDLKISWGGQCSISTIQRHPDLLELAAKSGCKALYFGLESISPTTMKKFNKSMSSLENLETQVKKIKDAGIHFHASIIFGFDDDTKAVFPEALEFLHRNKISTASFHIMTPFPGTKFFDDMLAQGRVLTTKWIDYHWDTVVFKPIGMTPDQLLEGYIWAKQEYSRFGNVLKRFPGNFSHPLLHFAGNLGTKMEVKHHKKKWNELKLQPSLGLPEPFYL
ncbi:MAG: B12-binding domain-containing radical SAM protein [Spirochaetia bacterium]|nr:B12-binding domain-containing radical SAM protein [Spirochaetia bacterium]